MNLSQSISALRAGDKIRFLTKAHGLFIGYVHYLTGSHVKLKGCKLVEPVESLQDVASLVRKDIRTFLAHELVDVEVLEPAPF